MTILVEESVFQTIHVTVRWLNKLTLSPVPEYIEKTTYVSIRKLY
jgi:hypothetical protein